MKPLKLFGMVVFCALLSPTQGVLSGLSCAFSEGAMQQVLSNAMIQSGLLQEHLQDLALPNVMSDGGLLDSPTIITGMRLERSWQPTVTVVLLPGTGIQLITTVHLDLSGNCMIGLLSDVIATSVDVTITTNIKCTHFELGAVQVIVDDCFCAIGAVNIKLLSGFLTLSVHSIVLSHLTATLPGLLCPVMDAVLSALNARLLGTLDVVIPLGLKGVVEYRLISLPYTSGSYLMLDLDGTVQQTGGSIIPHNSYASALPMLLGRWLVMCIRQSFLNSMLILYLRLQAHIFPCSSETFSEANRLRDSIIALFPPGCTSCSAAAPLSIRVEGAKRPILVLESNKATVKMTVLLQVFSNRPDESIINLLLLQADLTLNAHLSISRGCLMLVFSMGSVSLFLETSDIGITDISSLKPLITKLMVEKYVPLLNATVVAGIPLPSVFGITPVNAELHILTEMLVISM